MKESSSCCKASARALLVSRESDVHHVVMVCSEIVHAFRHEGSVVIVRCKFLTLISNRNVLDVEYRFASSGSHEVKKLIRVNFSDVLLGHCYRYSIDKSS